VEGEHVQEWNVNNVQQRDPELMDRQSVGEVSKLVGTGSLPVPVLSIQAPRLAAWGHDAVLKLPLY
jgi:hypothetical protein